MPMNSPLRYWRTGAVAVVMAALGQAGTAAPGVAEDRSLVRRHSPFSLPDTVLRIEGSAREHGMPVFVRAMQGRASLAQVGQGVASLVIVLESSLGGTPVLMGPLPAHLELPLSVIVQRAADDRVEVLCVVPSAWDAMPDALTADLARLGLVLSMALHG
jgi:uncharacterized protein (DUF302 family)